MKNKFSELKKILNDNKSGSYDILIRLKKHFLRYSNDLQYILDSVPLAEKQLSHFAAINNFIRKFKTILNSGDKKIIKSFLTESLEEQNNLILTLFEKHKSLLLRYQTITTISYSKTLLELFILLSKKNSKLKIFLLESRPMLEGRVFARELIRNGIKCTLVVDSLMNYAVENSDAVIFGADQILSNGNVVNKAGSYPLAVCAKEDKKPVFVIATKDKFSNSHKFIAIKENSDQVWRFRHKKLKIVNIYFEEIPKKYITKILS